MTSNYHTPIAEGAAANAKTFNDPLGQMDEALSEALLAERDGHIIQDEGVDLAQQPRINFTGAGVTVTNAAGKTIVTIPLTDISGLLAKTGLTEWDEQGSNPATPAANKWKVYFKSDGLYIIDDAGVAIGPIDIRNYLAKTGLTEWDEQGSDPATPAANKWKVYFKSGGLYIKDDAGVVIGPIKVGGGDLYNYIINGGFDYAERNVTPGTLFTVADKDYGPDHWWSTRENTELQYNVNDAIGETGLTSKNYGTYKKITNAGKFVVVQVIKGINSVPLRGKQVTFQIKMKASASKTIRMSVLELQNAGTIDAPPATLVTAFGADTVDPTFGTNVAIITAAESKSVTNSWQSFSVTVTVPSNSKNVMAAFWTDSDFAANDTLSVAEAGLYITDTVQAWKPRLDAAELLLCQHYFYRWGYQNSDTGTGFRMFGNGGAGVYEGQSIMHPVEMRTIPTSVVNGTWGTTNITGSLSVVDLSTKSATLSVQVTAAGSFDIFTNDISDWISFEAEIL